MTTDIRLAQALNPRMQAALDLGQPIVSIESLSLWYGEKRALKNISMSVPAQRITAYIGPSGCGKSTLLRCFNRMNDLVDGVRIEGKIRIGGIDTNTNGRRMRRNADARTWDLVLKIKTINDDCLMVKVILEPEICPTKENASGIAGIKFRAV